MHENPSAPITLQKDLMKLGSWNTLLFEVVFFFMISPWLDLSLWLPLWKSSCLITLEIWSLVLNLVLLSSKSILTKPWFHTRVLPKIKRVQLVFQVFQNKVMHMPYNIPWRWYELNIPMNMIMQYAMNQIIIHIPCNISWTKTNPCIWHASDIKYYLKVQLNKS